MPFPYEDGWPVSLDEFSLDNPVNTSSTNGRYDRLVRLHKDNPQFAEVERLFVKGWRHRRKARPAIHDIFKVLWPQFALEPFLSYRDRVQDTLKAKGNLGNEKLLFHGTDRACLLGESPTSVLLCGIERCYLCSILRSSFDMSRCGKLKEFVQAIRAWYLYYILLLDLMYRITEADDYVTNLSGGASLRVVILSRVVVGRPDKRSRNAPHLTAPPPGYDSIAGEIGWDLNYEETVTYDNDTVRPAYLVVYGDKPPFVEMIFKTPIGHPAKSRRVPNLNALVQMMFKTPIVS